MKSLYLTESFLFDATSDGIYCALDYYFFTIELSYEMPALDCKSASFCRYWCWLLEPWPKRDLLSLLEQSLLSGRLLTLSCSFLLASLIRVDLMDILVCILVFSKPWNSWHDSSLLQWRILAILQFSYPPEHHQNYQEINSSYILWFRWFYCSKGSCGNTLADVSKADAPVFNIVFNIFFHTWPIKPFLLVGKLLDIPDL